MNAYGLEHIINELVEEKSVFRSCNTTARGKTNGAKNEIYQRSWSALNLWAETKLAKQKGAGVSGFGCFCWELKKRGGKTICRPILILSDNFVKAYRVKRERVFVNPQTTPIEEVNYSQLAIKFSKELTKDMVFSGLRDIFKKIGEYIDRGAELDIQFSFGSMYAKENRVKFTFNQARLQELLPESVSPNLYGFESASDIIYDDVTTDAGGMTARSNQQVGKESYKYGQSLADTARRSDSAGSEQQRTMQSLLDGTGASFGSSLPRIPSAEGATAASKLKIPALSLAGSTAQQQQQQQQHISGRMSTAQSRPEQDEPTSSSTAGKDEIDFGNLPPSVVLPADLREVLDGMADKKSTVNKEEFRRKAKERVLEQAFLRCLEDVEDYASRGDKTMGEAQAEIDKWRSELEADKEKERAKMKKLKSTLDAQIALSQLRQKEAMLEQKASVSGFILGEKAGIPPVPLGATRDEQGNIISARAATTKALLNQIQKNATDKAQEKKDTAVKERNYLDRLAVEVELQEAMERSTQLEKQRALLEAWERDGHLRNLRKLTPFGPRPVKDYIEHNMRDSLPHSFSGFSLPDSTITTAPPVKPETPNLNAKFNMSIGYDPRKGKIG